MEEGEEIFVQACSADDMVIARWTTQVLNQSWVRNIINFVENRHDILHVGCVKDIGKLYVVGCTLVYSL